MRNVRIKSIAGTQPSKLKFLPFDYFTAKLFDLQIYSARTVLKRRPHRYLPRGETGVKTTAPRETISDKRITIIAGTQPNKLKLLPFKIL